MLVDPKTRWLLDEPMPHYLNGDLINVKFIPAGGTVDYTNNIYQFTGPDSFQKYQDNLNTMPADWWYRTKPVQYKINTSGYRAPEWKDVNWEASVVIFGCSMTFGVGLAEDETISWYLSQILNRPVINLGVGGSSIQFACYNAAMVHRNLPMPWAVINLWTDINRVARFSQKGINHEGAWSMTKESLMDRWTEDPVNSLIHAQMMVNLGRELWKGKTQYWEGTFFEHTAKYLNLEMIKFDNTARDNMHCGRFDTLRAAQRIAGFLG
jgi:hypothetical protein